ncbi:MAG: hypothetical protein SFT91_03760, partial [Rickettsiaceae bacterium]|nr:hypothetical protein [Rickettsiaceae bacterium]
SCLIIICALLITSPPIPMFGNFKNFAKHIAFENDMKITLLALIFSTFFSFIYCGRIVIGLTTDYKGDKSRISYVSPRVFAMIYTSLLALIASCFSEKLYWVLSL